MLTMLGLFGYYVANEVQGKASIKFKLMSAQRARQQKESITLSGHDLKSMNMTFVLILPPLHSLISSSTHYVSYYYSDYCFSLKESFQRCMYPIPVKEAEWNCFLFLPLSLSHSRNHTSDTVTSQLPSTYLNFYSLCFHDNHTDI